LFAAWGFTWRRGWRAELTFDRPARTLTIVQHPWMRARTITIDAIAGVEASHGIVSSTYGAFRWEQVVLRGTHRKRLWRYRTMFTPKTYRRVQEAVESMRQFLESR
jgi:hypothetical protein